MQGPAEAAAGTRLPPLKDTKRGEPYTMDDELAPQVDKCCIPQTHALMPTCVGLLEEFIRRSDGMIVLLSWHYFERLWV